MKKILYLASVIAFLACGSSKNTTDDDAVRTVGRESLTVNIEEDGTEVISEIIDTYTTLETATQGATASQKERLKISLIQMSIVC